MKLLVLLLLAVVLGVSPAHAEPSPADAPAVAMLRYAGGKTGECFADRFLARFNAATNRAVAGEMQRVEALDLDAAEHRVAILTGEGPFRLKPGEVASLRTFLTAGGLLIASTGCSDPGATGSLEAALPELLPEAAGFTRLWSLPVDHPAFQRIFTVETSTYAKGPPRLPLLRGSHRPDGSLAFVWSPEGLNDTLGVAGPCCCCGGNEVRAAEELLVNLLAIGLGAEAK